MHPEIIELPFLDMTVKSYGLMLVIGFLLAVFVIRRLSKEITPDPDLITNAALYSLIAGIVGARIFYVVHYWEKFKDNLLSIFAVWEGGLELLGGVVLAMTVLVFYMIYHKLPVRKYLDVLAVGLMIALAFGRIGCFLNGCCYGKPTSMPWGVEFPYGSYPYSSAALPDADRGRDEAYMQLPEDYYIEYYDDEGELRKALKAKDDLTPGQLEAIKSEYVCVDLHPTQLYSSFDAGLISFILFLFWRRSQKWEGKRILTKPGQVFGLMLVFYSIHRFLMEFLRDDNPFELDGLTISQLISMGLFVLGVLLLAVFHKMRYNPKQQDDKD